MIIDPDPFEELEELDLNAPGNWQLATEEGRKNVFVEVMLDGRYRAVVDNKEFFGASVIDVLEQVREQEAKPQGMP